MWGTPKYEDMYSAVVEVSRRYSKNSRVLDLFTAPTPVFRSSDADARTRFNVEASDSDAEAQRKILEGQVGMLEEDTFHLPDDLLDVQYLQPIVTGVDQAMKQVEMMMQSLRDQAGLPNLQGQTLSGEVLKRLFVHWFAESSQMQGSLSLAAERLLGVPVVWPHPFDTSLFFSKTADATSDPEALPVTDPPPEAPPEPPDGA